MLEQWVLGPFNFMMSDLMRVEGVSRSPSTPLDDRGIDAIDSPSSSPDLNPIIVYRHITQLTVQELTDGNPVLAPPQEEEASFINPRRRNTRLLRMHMHEGGQSQ